MVKNVFFYITFFVARAGDRKVEVGAVEAGGQAQGVPQAEQADDVLADLFGRGGRERADGRAARQPGQERRDLEIARAEILPPLRNAVRFVHRHKAHIQALAQGGETFGLQAFGRGVEDAERAAERLLHKGAVGLLVLAGMQAGGGDALLPQGGDLVLHERDQRRDDQRNAAEQHGRDLVAGRFARAGGHDGQHIPPGCQRVNDGLLPGAERAVAEIGLQGGEFVHIVPFLW